MAATTTPMASLSPTVTTVMTGQGGHCGCRLRRRRQTSLHQHRYGRYDIDEDRERRWRRPVRGVRRGNSARESNEDARNRIGTTALDTSESGFTVQDDSAFQHETQANEMFIEVRTVLSLLSASPRIAKTQPSQQHVPRRRGAPEKQQTLKSARDIAMVDAFIKRGGSRKRRPPVQAPPSPLSPSTPIATLSNSVCLYGTRG